MDTSMTGWAAAATLNAAAGLFASSAALAITTGTKTMRTATMASNRKDALPILAVVINAFASGANLAQGNYIWATLWGLTTAAWVFLALDGAEANG